MPVPEQDMAPRDTAGDGAPPMLELRVLAGMHAGAALPLDVRVPLTVGSDEACDLTLLDAGVEPLHWTLAHEQAAWQEQRSGRPVPLGVPQRVGEAVLVLCPFDEPWLSPQAALAAVAPAPDPAVAPTHTARAAAPGWPVWVAAGLALLLLVVAAALVWGSGLTASRTAPPVASAPASARQPAPASAQALRAMAHTALFERGLAELVSVTATDGLLTLDADLDADERARFDAALAELRQRLAGRARVDSHARPLAQAMNLHIRSVVSGPVSYITLEDGRQVFVGGTVDGLELVAIQPGRIVLRGRRTFEVAW